METIFDIVWVLIFLKGAKDFLSYLSAVTATGNRTANSNNAQHISFSSVGSL
jgi:hypothetical protein